MLQAYTRMQDLCRPGPPPRERDSLAPFSQSSSQRASLVISNGNPLIWKQVKSRFLALEQFSREFGRCNHRPIMARAFAQDCTKMGALGLRCALLLLVPLAVRYGHLYSGVFVWNRIEVLIHCLYEMWRTNLYFFRSSSAHTSSHLSLSRSRILSLFPSQYTSFISSEVRHPP